MLLPGPLAQLPLPALLVLVTVAVLGYLCRWVVRFIAIFSPRHRKTALLIDQRLNTTGMLLNRFRDRRGNDDGQDG